LLAEEKFIRLFSADITVADLEVYKFPRGFRGEITAGTKGHFWRITLWKWGIPNGVSATIK